MNKLKILPMILMFLGCSNSHESVLDEVIESDLIDVVFNVNSLNVSVEELEPSKLKSQTTRASIDEIVNSIRYYIFDENNKYVASGSNSFQPDLDPVPVDFGKIKVKLMPGTYKVIFYAQGKGDGYFNANNLSEKLYYDSYFTTLDKEVFYYTGDLNVSVTNASFDISLSRISGLLRINITDNLISDVKKVTITIREYNRWYCLGTGESSLQNPITNTYEATLGETTMEIFDHYVVRPQNLTVSIKVLGDADYLLGEKNLTVPIYENRKTIVSLHIPEHAHPLLTPNIPVSI